MKIRFTDEETGSEGEVTHPGSYSQKGQHEQGHQLPPKPPH
jgi:hypothetical protein